MSRSSTFTNCRALSWRFLPIAWLCALPSAAADLRGTVQFGGLPLPGAAITAQPATGEKKVAVTGIDGTYSFSGLADGQWTIRVEMLCFAPADRQVAVAEGAPPENFDLNLLPLEEIRAIAPATGAPTAAPAPPMPPPIRAGRKARKPSPATPATVQSGFQRTDVNAAVSPAGAGDGAGAAQGEAGQSAVDSFAINGSANNAAASPFGMSQAFGNNRRGPGSLYTGNVGVVLGNSALDARSYSVTGQDTPKPAYNHLTGMASLGGPLKIPYLIGGNSPAAFFVSYQMMRNRNASTLPATMPTAAQRAGNLGGDTVPASLISPQAQALLAFYPLPNFASNTGYNYQTALTSVSDQDNVQARLSKSLGRADQVFGTFGYQNTRSDSVNLFGFGDTTGIAGIDLTANWSRRVSPRAFVTSKIQFNRLATRVTPFFADRIPVEKNAGIAGNDQDPLTWGPPTLNFSGGIAALSDAQQSFNRNQTAAVSENAYWSHSPHNFTFGGDYRRQQFNYLGQQDPRGTFTFTGLATGSDFGDFLRGIWDTSSIAFGNADKYFRASIYDLYMTDDWRVTPGLTINAGARWEYNSPIDERYGRLANLSIGPGFRSATPETGSPLVRPDKHGIQPRIGISWRPIAGSSLVVRTGYGVNYNTSVYQALALRMAQQAPFSQSLAVSNTLPKPLTLANGFPDLAATAQDVFALDPNFRVGYAQSWQLTVQRDLPGSMVMTAGYLGIKGTRAQQEFLPNTYPVGAVDPSGFSYVTSNGNSTRQSGQFQLRRRLHAGFTSTLQYTYSKAIDDAAPGGRGTASSIAQNWLALSAERGLSSFDQRHVASLQAQYTTGMGVAGGTLLDGWKGTLFKDWTVVSQITAASGTPLSPVYPAAVAGTGFSGSIRPDYTGAPLYAAPPGLHLNPLAYTAPAQDQWGNAGRNSIEGPRQFSLVAGMTRTFRLRDRLNMDFRLDSTNAINHVTYQAWNTIWNAKNGQFGLPTQANPMRTVTATVRVRF